MLKVWNEGVETLEKNIEKYDIGYWSLYNLIQRHPATQAYHSLHIKQLKVLYEITGIEIFNEYAKKWEKYLNNSLNKIIANLKRGIVHIKTYGFIGIIKKYNLIRNYKKNNH